MKRGVKYSQIGVKVAIGSGILLGLALLTQTVATYVFVYNKIVQDQTAQEIERKEAVLLRSAFNAKVTDARQFGPLLDELKRDSPREIAWLRIIDRNSKVLAQAGTPAMAVPTPDQMRQQLQMHQSRRQIVKSAAGDILVVDSRLRFFGRPGERPPPPESTQPGSTPRGLPQFGSPQFGSPQFGSPQDPGPMFSEIAIYIDRVTVDFGPLRQNLIVGCLAAVALLVSMVLIAVLSRRYIRARQLEQQLELARSVQTDLLPAPQRGEQPERLDFAAAFLPAATIGGDFYDVFTGENAPISIVLGDVAGKGISAALLMGVLHGAIRSMRWTRSAVDQEEASQWLNRFLCEKTARERFVSLFWAYFLPETGMLRYINAGHLPPLLVRAAAKSGVEVERLETGGPVLGLLPNAQYCSGTTRVDPGDILVVFSDGVAEAANARDEEFGESRIAEIVRKNVASDPQAICDAILREVGQFLGDMKPHDDQTLLVVRLLPAQQPVTGSAYQDSSLPLIG